MAPDTQQQPVGVDVGRKRKVPLESLGERLRRLRSGRGFTHLELGNAIGASQRMIAYYEIQGGNPPADVLAKLAQALRVSVDEIVHGDHAKAVRAEPPPQDLRLIRKLRQVEKLPPKDRRSVLQLIDALIEKENLKRAHG